MRYHGNEHEVNARDSHMNIDCAAFEGSSVESELSPTQLIDVLTTTV